MCLDPTEGFHGKQLRELSLKTNFVQLICASSYSDRIWAFGAELLPLSHGLLKLFGFLSFRSAIRGAMCGAKCDAANSCIPLINLLNESKGLERPGCIVSLGIEG